MNEQMIAALGMLGVVGGLAIVILITACGGTYLLRFTRQERSDSNENLL